MTITADVETYADGHIGPPDFFNLIAIARGVPAGKCRDCGGSGETYRPCKRCAVKAKGATP